MLKKPQIQVSSVVNKGDLGTNTAAPIRTPLTPKSYLEIERAVAEIREEHSTTEAPF